MYKKILIINPFGIGDVLFTTPVVHTLKELLPGLKIGYLCNRRTAPILENNPYLDYIFIYERDEFEAARKRSFPAWIKKILFFLGQIKKERFDMALDFSLNKQYGFFSWCAGIKERIGYDFKKRGSFLTRKIKLPGYQGKHIVEYYGGLLRFAGLDLKYRDLEIYLNEADKAWAEEALRREGLDSSASPVAIIPGAGKSWGRDSYLKHWRLENFACLADKIIEKYKTAIIILGDFSEKEIADRVAKLMQRKAVNLCGATTTGQFAALLSRAKLVIANDGGPLHMAVALGKKTISFFGPVDPQVYGPYPVDRKRHIVLRKELACSPCYRNFRLAACQNAKACLEGITVNEAMAAADSLLS